MALDEDLEVVTCAGVGSNINWTASAGVVATSIRPDFETCVGDPAFFADAQHSGLRVVRLEEHFVRHKWFVLADAPSCLADAFEATSPRRKQKRNSEAITNRLGLVGQARWPF